MKKLHISGTFDLPEDCTLAMALIRLGIRLKNMGLENRTVDIDWNGLFEVVIDGNASLVQRPAPAAGPDSGG